MPLRSMRLAVTASAVLLLSSAAGASAHSRSTPASVRAHVQAAEDALQRVADRVAAHDEATAAIAFAANRVETRRAQAEAERVVRRDAVRGAAATRTVAAQQHRNARVFAALVAPATGAVEVQIAKGLAASLKGRERAHAQLSALADRLPAKAAAGIARAIAAMSYGAEADGQLLADAVRSGTVSAAALPWIEFALAQMTAALGTATTQLQTLLPTLPAPAQTAIEQALDTVAGILDTVGGILSGISSGGGAPDAAPEEGSSLPVPAGLPGPPIQIPLPNLPIPGGRG